MKRLVCLLFFFASTTACANESAKALQDAFMHALRANNADGIAACYTADASNYPVDSMVGTGPDSVRESWLGFFANFRVLDASLSGTHMEILGDTAVAWGLFKITAMPAEGDEPIEILGRYMDVAKMVDGTWLYIADHASVPLPSPPAE